MRVIPRDVSGVYARSLHRDHYGEWDFDLAWKPLKRPGRCTPAGSARSAAGRPGCAAGSTSTRRCCGQLDAVRPPDLDDDPDLMCTDVVLDVDRIAPARRPARRGTSRSRRCRARSRRDPLPRAGPRRRSSTRSTAGSRRTSTITAVRAASLPAMDPITGLAYGRIAVGTLVAALPVAGREALPPRPEGQPAAAYMTRMFGSREIALGAITLACLRRGARAADPARRRRRRRRRLHRHRDRGLRRGAEEGRLLLTLAARRSRRTGVLALQES